MTTDATSVTGGETATGTGVPANDLPAVLPADGLTGVGPADEGSSETAEDVTGKGCPGRAPGRPRSARADEAIIEAVLDLLADGVSFGALSMEAVAARAGVGKATIYRRWPNKETLVVEAMAALKGPIAPLEGKSLRDDLLALMRPIAQARNTRAGRIMPCIIPEMQRNPELARVYQNLSEPRRERMREVLRKAVANGQVRPDIDIEMTCVMLVGPLTALSVLNFNQTVEITKMPEYIVDTILDGILA